MALARLDGLGSHDEEGHAVVVGAALLPEAPARLAVFVRLEQRLFGALAREPAERHAPYHQVQRKLRQSDEEAADPLGEGEGRAAHRRVEPRRVHHQNLHEKLHRHDGEEEFVVEDPRKHVCFPVDLPCIDLVEELQHDERREDEGVVLGGHPVLLRALAAILLRPQRQHGAVFGEGKGAVVLRVEERDAEVLFNEDVLVERRGAPRFEVAQCVVPRHSAVVAPRRRRLAHIPHREDQEEQDEDLPHGVAHERAEHHRREERLVPRVRPALQHIRARVLGRERERRERVHDHVDPQQLDDRQRRLGEDRRAQNRDRARCQVHRELELEELADVVVDAPPPLDGRDDRLEVVVQDHNVCRLLRHLGSVDVHGEANVSLLQRGRVVGPIARHGHHLPVEPANLDARLLDTRDEHELVGGGGAREHAQLWPDLVELVLVDALLWVLRVLGREYAGAELLARHRNLAPRPLPVLRKDAGLAGDGLGGGEVVSGDHAHGDASLPAHADRPRHLLAKGVLDTHHRDQNQVSLDLVGQRAVRVCRGLLQGLVRDRDGAEAEVGKGGDRVLHVLAQRVVDVHHLAVGVHVLRAQRHHHLGRALGEEHPGGLASLRHRHEGGHALALGREGDARAPWLRLGELLTEPLVRHIGVASLALELAENVDELDHRALGRVPRVRLHHLALQAHHLLHVLAVNHLLHGLGNNVGLVRGVDGHCRHHLLPQLLRHLPRHLLGLHLLAGDPGTHHCHHRGGEGARLVRADRSGGPHGLAGGGGLDHVHVRHHLRHREGEGDGDGEREALGDGDDEDCDADDEELDPLHVVHRVVPLLLAARLLAE
mmetsp:Transcript_6507/g.15344  ORF Transcript_6507/g.15344 Transcript_6507/m.15344 type:complete len:829 (+) Transcript_6507:166-2652(+)